MGDVVSLVEKAEEAIQAEEAAELARRMMTGEVGRSGAAGGQWRWLAGCLAVLLWLQDGFGSGARRQ